MLQVTHTLSISSQNTGYRFGATYVGTKGTQTEGETFPVFLADTDISGNTSATVLHQFADRWRVKVQAQTQGTWLWDQFCCTQSASTDVVRKKKGLICPYIYASPLRFRSLLPNSTSVCRFCPGENIWMLDKVLLG